MRPTVLIAMNGFKGTLTNEEACAAVSEALTSLDIRSQSIPIGDGGRGTLSAIQNCLRGDLETFTVSGPLGDKVQARVFCLPNREEPTAIYVESSDSCGHHLIAPERKDALRANSYGLGEVLLAALKKWEPSLKRVYVGLGDSAISDAGMGMLTALGYVFHDDSGRPLWGNANSLRSVRTIVPLRAPWVERIKFTVLCDVLNPLCGPRGSARTFAPQKGATSEGVKLIEQGMENFAAVHEAATKRKLRDEPMTGSAGGLSFAFAGFLNTELVLGARFLMDWIFFDKHLAQHALLITGEGKTDRQTLSGKAPWECLERARRAGKKVVIFSGALGEGINSLIGDTAIVGIFATGDHPTPYAALRDKVREIFGSLDLEHEQPLEAH